MDFFQGQFPIIKKENLSKNCYSIIIFCPEIANKSQAGQFCQIKVDGFSLRRPISICDIDKKSGTIRLVFEVRGDGTKKLAELNENALIDIIAPLGHGFTILPNTKKAIAIGGGIGVPPMLLTIKEYGENAKAIIGFRSSNVAILADDFSQNKNQVILCTDDGSAGQKGFVTTALEQELAKENADIIYACGPHLMIKGIIEIAKKHNIKCEVSLEERMGCGIGACLVCACKTVKNGEEYMAHVCKDGPVFDSNEVIIDG